MGKGGYTGGSTHLGRGSSWFRPESDLDYPTGRVGKTRTPREQLEARLDAWATEVCRSFLEGRDAPAVPDWLPEEVIRRIERDGGLRKWASGRPEWQNVTKEIEQEQRRRLFLLRVAQWMVEGGVQPTVPAALSAAEKVAIGKFKKLDAWARSQADIKWALKKAAGEDYHFYL